MTIKTIGTSIFGTALIVGLASVAGCAAPGEEGTGASRALEASTCSAEEVATKSVGTKGIAYNGAKFNGLSLNGINFNGIDLNGLSLNGVRLNGLSLNGMRMNGSVLQGITINGPVIQGTTFNGWNLNGVTLEGTQFVGLPQGTNLTGAKFVGELSDGSTISIFIDEVRANPDAKNADVALYAVSVGDTHIPLCGRDESGAPVMATAIANVWDEQTGSRIDDAKRFTFACTGGALYKCVAAGYKPWKGASLADYHQACTRMIRADYCGDGTSYTKDGTLIDMGDGLGIQKTETDGRADFAFEAAWGPNGATCVSKTRYRLTSIPSCLEGRMADSCDGVARASGVDLINRSAAQTSCLR